MDENIKYQRITGANNLAGLIDFQTNSVVSKTIINKKTGTITLFAFDIGEGLSEHTTPFDAMIYIIEGEADITISGNVNRVKSGEDNIASSG